MPQSTLDADANDAEATHLFFIPCPGLECQHSGKSFEWLDVKDAQFIDVKRDGDIVTHLSKYLS